MGFLGPVAAFLEPYDEVVRLDGPDAEIDPAERPERPRVVVPRPVAGTGAT